MLAPVDGFLRHEAAHTPLQFSILDLAAIGFHTIDEKLFAERKEDRHGVKEGGSEGIAAVPVGGEGLVDIELPVTRNNFDIFRRTGGHRVVHVH